MNLVKLFFVPLVFVSAFPLFHNEPAPDQDQPTPIVIDEPLLINGLEVKDFNRRRCIQLKDGAGKGLAEAYFFEPSASYDLTVFYVDESGGRAELAVNINGRPAGSIQFNEEEKKANPSFSFKKKTLPAISIQQASRISLEFTGDGAEKCRIEKLVLARVGEFQGQPEKLKPPQTLQVFETAKDRKMAREMLPGYVNGRIDGLMNERVAALRQLKTPEAWTVQQEKSRGELETFFGRFPERTPLNVKITGTIDREKYTIQKLYFESRPHYYVTANLYLPKNRKLPVPAALFTCGHSHNGKNSVMYHSACLGLVMKGYVVLAIDPTGQGERIEYFDENTQHDNLDGAVDQHYYLGRPSFLVNRTLSGLRVWDAVRALDYLVSRPEVDTSQIAAVGNSGGGQMALLITALDKRIKVCAAGHPGGQMEKNYLPGQNLIDRQIFSLIAPRPVRIIVGERSGEEAPHRKKIEDLQLFMEGLGYNSNRAEIKMVDGVHDMRQPKREATYEWLNRWFGKEDEGSSEPPLTPEDEKNLLVTKSGLTLVSLGGETGQSLNELKLKKIYKPVKDTAELKQRIARRIGMVLDKNRPAPRSYPVSTLSFGSFTVEKLSYQSEDGVLVPSLLIKPKRAGPDNPVYIYVSDRGKPRTFEDTLIPFQLAEKGYIVLAIDVRGVGETSPTPSLPVPIKNSSCTPLQWIHDCLAIQSPGFGRTMLAMRTYDLMRGIDYLRSRKDLRGRRIVLYGEGQGGLWSLLAAIYDGRVKEVVAEGTLATYTQLVANRYYAVSSDYFWVPGALCDFDIPDLVQLASGSAQIWLGPVNGMGQRMDPSEARTIVGTNKNIHIFSSSNQTEILRTIQP